MIGRDESRGSPSGKGYLAKLSNKEVSGCLL